MSLSPLYPGLENNLHINTPTALHQSFPWLQPAQAQFAPIRVLAQVLSSPDLRRVNFLTPRLIQAVTRT